MTVDDQPTGEKSKKTRDIYLSPEAPVLCGHRSGNNDHPGCLTRSKNVRLHSCEAGTDCQTINSPNTVWIAPIITHTADGGDVLEVGAGGGEGDLSQYELELDDREMIVELLRSCSRAIKDTSIQGKISKTISDALHAPIPKIPLDELGSTLSHRNLSFEDLARFLADAVTSGALNADHQGSDRGTGDQQKAQSKAKLPRHIVR